jgi:hypothetical protein
MKTTECNEAIFPSSGHRNSPPSLPSLGAHAQASSQSPPCTQQYISFPPLPCASFLELSLCVTSPSSPCHLPPTATVSASTPCLPAWSQCRSTAQNHRAVEGSVTNAIVTKQINHARLHMTKIINTQHQFLTIFPMRRWRSIGSNAKLEHIQYLCLYVSSSSDLATLQGSPHQHMSTGTPLGRGNGSKAFSVIRP